MNNIVDTLDCFIEGPLSRNFGNNSEEERRVVSTMLISSVREYVGIGKVSTERLTGQAPGKATGRSFIFHYFPSQMPRYLYKQRSGTPVALGQSLQYIHSFCQYTMRLANFFGRFLRAYTGANIVTSLPEDIDNVGGNEAGATCDEDSLSHLRRFSRVRRYC